MKQFVIFPPVVERQRCFNCKVSLGMEKILPNFIDMKDDAYGIPSLIVRCPVCKTAIEWETSSN